MLQTPKPGSGGGSSLCPRHPPRRPPRPRIPGSTPGRRVHTSGRQAPLARPEGSDLCAPRMAEATEHGTFWLLGRASAQGAMPGLVGLLMDTSPPEPLWTLCLLSPCHWRGEAVSWLPGAAVSHPKWGCGSPCPRPLLQAPFLARVLSGQLMLHPIELASLPVGPPLCGCPGYSGEWPRLLCL